MPPFAHRERVLRSTAHSRVFGAMFFFSGLVALLYQAAWQREFTLLFGSAAPATASVLAAFFAGLGMGSYLFGKLGARLGQPLRTYALLEIVIAIGVLLVQPILSLYADGYPALVLRFQNGGASFLVIKSALAFVAIALPTMAMGGTLPVLAQLFENRRTHFGELAGLLYLLNTVGAAVGVLAFPILLSLLGMNLTIYSCVGTNLAIATAAWLLAKENPLQRPRPGEKVPLQRTIPIWPWVSLAFASGFITFVLQVGWNRVFAQIHENSIYSFAFIVALFIIAIAVGAQLARILLRKRVLPSQALSRAWLISGLLTLVAPFLFLAMSRNLSYAGDSSGTFFSFNLAIPAIVVVFVPVTFLAVGLPLILQQLANASKRAAADLTGRVLASNITGSVVGALVGGFLFPYAFGLWGTIILSGTIILIIASLLAGRSLGQRLAFASICLLAGWIVSRAPLPRTRIDSARNEKLLALKEGAHGVIAVVDRGGSRRIKMNNHYVLGGTFATGDERLQAHIPLLLHPNPKRVAFLGYGTGITAAGALLHNPSNITALELVPEVVPLANEFFSRDNQNFSEQPSARLIIDDARNYLRGTREEFDVIIGDLVVPWRPGEGALYTQENFVAARKRLSPNGLYCAWFPFFQLGEEDFRLILRTFQTVFDNVTVWRGDFSPTEPALALIGSLSADQLDPVTVERRIASTRSDPLNPQLKNSRAFWMHLVGVPDPQPHISVKPHQINSENRPQVEMRLNRSKPFVGRALQAWENGVRKGKFTALLLEKLPAEARSGLEAGGWMTEFTLLLSEGKQKEAAQIQQRIRDTLRQQAAQSVFGN